MRKDSHYMTALCPPEDHQIFISGKSVVFGMPTTVSGDWPHFHKQAWRPTSMTLVMQVKRQTCKDCCKMVNPRMNHSKIFCSSWKKNTQTKQINLKKKKKKQEKKNTTKNPPNPTPAKKKRKKERKRKKKEEKRRRRSKTNTIKKSNQ